VSKYNVLHKIFEILMVRLVSDLRFSLTARAQQHRFSVGILGRPAPRTVDNQLRSLHEGFRVHNQVSIRACAP
jgi:hypothetical protein